MVFFYAFILAETSDGEVLSARSTLGDHKILRSVSNGKSSG